MKFKSRYFVGIILAIIIIGISFFVTHYLKLFERWFWASVVVALLLGSLQIWADYTKELRRQKEIELQFLEFTRGLVESVKGGISIPNAIRHVSTKDFGALSPYAKKLANQMEWGIPVHRALVTFAKDTENDVIKRAISIIIEADESGGDIEDILDSVTESVSNVKKMKVFTHKYCRVI
jgi:pilus assembly protein TadC